MLLLFKEKLLSFLTFKESLVDLNHFDKLLRSWVNFLTKTSSDLPDCRSCSKIDPCCVTF